MRKRAGMKGQIPFEVNRYRIGEGECRLRAVLVSDLHARQILGLLPAIRHLDPDFILAAGDMLECFRADNLEARMTELEEEAESLFLRWVGRCAIGLDGLYHRLRGTPETEEDNEEGYVFLRNAAEIAPTFYGLGNHEKYMLPKEKRRVEGTGVILLEDGFTEVRVRGLRLRIGCLMHKKRMEWLPEFCAGPGFQEGGPLRLLLCHRPEVAVKLPRLPIDGIFCGHAHGGQWRIGKQGIFSPGQGLFPRYTGGLHRSNILISRGLSNTAHVPRWGNPTEIILAEICP